MGKFIVVHVGNVERAINAANIKNVFKPSTEYVSGYKKISDAPPERDEIVTRSVGTLLQIDDGFVEVDEAFDTVVGLLNG